MAVHKVAVAGAGRIGAPVVQELVKAGYEVTVLTRNSAGLQGKSINARIVQVDYESGSSLAEALSGHQALVSTVAMSAIGSQTRIIDAALTAGVQYYIPAEYTVNSRDPNAQLQPMMASVVAIQRYLATKEDRIAWFVINCGALLEFVLDHPVLVDFVNHAATLWDGGEGALSVSDIPLLARAVSAVLQQPDRVQNHRVRIHGGTVSQARTLELARRYSTHAWIVTKADSQTAYSRAMQGLKDGSASEPALLMENMFNAYTAATFGKCDGHFEAAYVDPDNARLGVDLFDGMRIEEAIRDRVMLGPYASRSATENAENLQDVSAELAATFTSAGKPGDVAS